jgi:hypothetical protein
MMPCSRSSSKIASPGRKASLRKQVPQRGDDRFADAHFGRTPSSLRGRWSRGRSESMLVLVQTLAPLVKMALVSAGLVSMTSCRPCSDELQVEVVANPLGPWRADPTEAFARNIWDLQAWDGRLYMGYGDAVVNTGPTKVFAYDPASGEVVHETTVNEEAIFRYRVFDQRLYIPGTDAVDTRDGSLYMRDDEGWTAFLLEDVVHAFDVRVLPDRTCVSVHDAPLGGAVLCSSDDGASWSRYSTESWRSRDFFDLGGRLYVSSQVSGVRRLDADRTTPVAFEIPGVGDTTDVIVTHPTNCGDELAFVAQRIEGPTAQPLGVFRAAIDGSGNITVVRVDLPDVTGMFDVEGRCHALANERLRCGRYQVTIYDSEDARTWSRRLSFVLPAFARSAEILDGQLFVGLGCERGSCDSTAGKIVRIPGWSNG